MKMLKCVLMLWGLGVRGEKEMVKAVLKSTSNTNMQKLIGTKGQLEVREGKFHFHFKDAANESYDLSSGIVRQMGDLAHPASKEVCFETKNSTYVFEKTENVRDGLFDWAKA